jgi:integrase
MSNSPSEAARKTETIVRSKTDQRYWIDRVELRSRSQFKSGSQETDYSVQMQFGGRRQRIALRTPNKTEASRRAASFYRALLSGGWQHAFDTHEFAKPTQQRIREESPRDETKAEKGEVTLGTFIKVYEEVTSARPASVLSYVKSIRKIFGDIAIVSKKGKFRSSTKGYNAWRKQVDGLPMSLVNADRVNAWKKNAVGATENEMERRSRTITANSLIRNAKSLFSRKTLPLLRTRLDLPMPLPFEGVLLDKQPSSRYRSRMDAVKLLAAAEVELKEPRPSEYLILCLALRCGLRRREIDTLLWSSVDLTQKVIHVESNAYYRLKSEDSEGDVDISETLAAELAAFRELSTSEFVVPCLRNARPGMICGDYRCMPHFQALTAWLREKGVVSKRPLHELRKEVGSLVANAHGIYEASRFLRHADIRITAAHYLDKKRRIVSPIG